MFSLDILSHRMSAMAILRQLQSHIHPKWSGIMSLMIKRLLLFQCLLFSLPLASQSSPRSIEVKSATTSCLVTVPRKSPLKDFPGSNVYWEGKLFVAGLTSDGTMGFSPNQVLPDGSLPQKFGWYRAQGLRGTLTITGKRIDAQAPPLRTDFSDYGQTGFQPSTLIFPTEGCWEVTGKVDTTSVTFVIRVIKLRAAKANG